MRSQFVSVFKNRDFLNIISRSHMCYLFFYIDRYRYIDILFLRVQDMLYNVSQFMFVGYFLMIRYRL